MEPILNEYILNHIFSYLKPHDLVHVSEVCQFWKQVASRQWRKITKILNEGYNPWARVPTISVNHALKIISHAALYVEMLHVFEQQRGFIFGKHHYIVMKPIPANTLLKHLNRTGANKVSAVNFCHLPPGAKIMRAFLRNNKVKTLKYVDAADYHQRIPTDKIEHLSLTFSGRQLSWSEDIKSFEGHFPNLQKLDLQLYPDSCADLPFKVSQILSHMLGIKALHIKVCMDTKNMDREISKVFDMFDDVFRMSRLEEFSLQITVPGHEYVSLTRFRNNFLTNIRKLPKIRVVHMDLCMKVHEYHRIMSTRSHLEKLKTVTRFDFFPMEFSRMDGVSKLEIIFPCQDPDVSGLADDLKKMPKLENLTLQSDGHVVSDKSQLKVVCDIVRVSTSQGKNVLLSSFNRSGTSKQLKIENKTEQCQTLHVDFDFRNEKRLLNSVMTFVQNELHDYHAYLEGQL